MSFWKNLIFSNIFKYQIIWSRIIWFSKKFNFLVRKWWKIINL